MIFQNFNLFSSRNAAGNIAYPLEISGLHKVKINKRVDELLDWSVSPAVATPP
jgi:D-methionine transport system ATP-binding protein